MLREKSSGLILYRLDTWREYLLLKHNLGHWDFAKGKIHEQEKEREAAIRETEEETGIQMKDLFFYDKFKEKISYVYNRDGTTIFKEVVFFLAKTTARDIILSEEHASFAWLPFDDALKRLTFQNAKNILRKAENTLL